MNSFCHKAGCYLFALSMVMLLSTPARAADSTIQISANLIATVCDVSTDSKDQTVDLGKVRTRELKNPFDASAWTSFSIKLENCPYSLSSVIATITGTPDGVNNVYFINTGTSKNIAIDVMSDAGDQQLSNGTTMTTIINLRRTAILKFKSRMISPLGGATAGTVVGLLELSFDFK